MPRGVASEENDSSNADIEAEFDIDWKHAS
jgi:hypothetical protein